MKRKVIRSLLEKAGPVGKVHHADFIDYVVVLENTVHRNGRVTAVEQPYMTVGGRLAMANRDHAMQDKRLNFEKPVVLENSSGRLTLQVTIESEVYGRRHGIASSRRGGNVSQIEKESQWEVAETSAIGRALGAMGYGLIPGAGLASADEILAHRSGLVRRESQPKAGEPSSGAGHRDGRRRMPGPTTAGQRVELVRLYEEIHGVTRAEAHLAIERLMEERFGCQFEKANYEMAKTLIAELNQTLQAKRNDGAAA